MSGGYGSQIQAFVAPQIRNTRGSCMDVQADVQSRAGAREPGDSA